LCVMMLFYPRSISVERSSIIMVMILYPFHFIVMVVTQCNCGDVIIN